ncbi:unnamed protein product [Lactuca saligna]|uniref:TIR domain-containing protein n=1 Tax=Lactuca saligna TaxID=75948 RepID=A0AA35VXB7_LACSI|nr:unnamed protein product [Lactuca saligna]
MSSSAAHTLTTGHRPPLTPSPSSFSIAFSTECALAFQPSPSSVFLIIRLILPTVDTSLHLRSSTARLPSITSDQHQPRPPSTPIAALFSDPRRPDDHQTNSFRGADTRYGFTHELHKALQNVNISTFFDDEDMETGGDLKPDLESAIKSSRVSIVVLSKTYASSSWCLNELILILEQRITSNQIVIPVFYYVEPTHVRKQQDTYGDAMAVHQQNIGAEPDAEKRRQLAEKMDRWIKALEAVADLKGVDVKGR